MLRTKKTARDLMEEIRQITEEYEKLAKEQKERILSLREENHDLAARLKQAEAQKAAVAAALIRAEWSSLQIVDDAKNRANRILSDAQKKELSAKQRVCEHNVLLGELAVQCERILKGIERELEKSKGKLPFELLSQKDA